MIDLRKQENLYRLLCLGIGIPGVLAGLALAIYAVLNIGLSRESHQWPQTSGIVVVCQQVSTQKGNEHYLGVEFRYQYHVEGKPYTGATVVFGSGTTDSDQQKHVLQNYPKGQQVTVYYSPADPTVACLEPGVSYGNYMGLALASFLGFAGLLTLVGAFLGPRRKKLLLFGIPAVVVLSVVLGVALYKAEPKPVGITQTPPR